MSLKRGEHTDERGIIMSQVGVGYARKWVVRFENDDEMAFHVRSRDIGGKQGAIRYEKAGVKEENWEDGDRNAHGGQHDDKEDISNRPEEDEDISNV